MNDGTTRFGQWLRKSKVTPTVASCRLETKTYMYEMSVNARMKPRREKAVLTFWRD